MQPIENNHCEEYKMENNNTIRLIKCKLYVHYNFNRVKHILLFMIMARVLWLRVLTDNTLIS